jgi:hypothetical protein
MSTNPDQNPKTGSFSDEIAFLEHRLQHAFQHQGVADWECCFLRLNFVSVYVRDQERSKRFFVEQLRFRAMTDVEFPSFRLRNCRKPNRRH